MQTKFRAITALCLATLAGTLSAEEQSVFTHSVQGGGVLIEMPSTFSGPIQLVVQDGTLASLPQTVLEDALSVKVLDMRGTEADLRLKASLMPLTNGEFVRPTTVKVTAVQGHNPDGVRSEDILAATSYTEQEGFIATDALVNRSFEALVEFTAEAVSGQQFGAGTYTGMFFLEIQ